jgi:hypothetical protein
MAVTKNSVELVFRNELLKETSFLDFYDKVPLSLRVHCVLNNITEISSCVCCDNLVTYNKAYPDKGFSIYCGPKCSRSDKTINKESLKKLSDREWLYEQRIILQKSKESIAEELGCSITPVNKWVKIHDIPDVKYNESNSLSLSHLRNKDWLYENHVKNHRTCEDIGNELGVSKSTVSVYLNKHEIETNDPNSYDRNSEESSKECMEIVDFIKSFYKKEIILNNRTILNRFELDIYLPEDNLAIEYNGVYSHIYRPHENSFSKIKGEKYHIYKTNTCEELGIQLLHIFSFSWKTKKGVWKSIIKNKLYSTQNKIYARQCVIKQVDKTTKRVFLENNHLQGKCPSTYDYGLYYNNELVSLMSFGRSRYNKKYDWELLRFCNKINYNIIGGFSKLLASFRKSHIGSIITYADRTYSNGNVYEYNGFKLLCINKPSYHYVSINKEFLVYRSNFTKKKLLQHLYKPEWTEEEIAFELGYSKIFDCGTKTYILE